MRKMKTITLPDEIVKELEQLSARFGVSPEEVIKRGINEYLKESEIQTKSEFEATGFGMWAERNDMEDSAQWVRKLREQEWNRS